MPLVTPPPYRVRTVRRPALREFDLARFERGLRQLYNDLPEERSGDKHSTSYVRLVLEVAGQLKPPTPEPKEMVPAREFASYFLDRQPGYSTTRAGLSALMFETWLVQTGGELFGLFLETVLESDSKYLTIFTGEIRETDLKLIGDKTRDFATFEVAVRAGDRDYKRGLISDVTMLDCTAKGSLKDPAKDPTKQGPNLDIGGAQTIESLLPSTWEEYVRVVEQGGLSTSAVAALFGGDPFRNVRVSGSVLFVEDRNGVRWNCTEGVLNGRRWIPNSDALLDVRTPKCDVSRPVPTPVRERARPTRPCVVSSSLYETADSGALRSNYGTWAVFEAPVEGGQTRTVVVVEDRAWTVDDSLADVSRAVEHVRSFYESVPPEFDVMVEAFLREFACDRGVEVSNPGELTVVLESRGQTRHDRDQIVHARNLRRLAEAGQPFPPAKEKPSPDAPADDEKEDGKEEPAPTPPPPPEPAPPSDHMDDPPFYREDLQGFYDTQLTLGLRQSEALQRVRQRFKVKGLIVTPAGEVRAPGVVDRPKDGQPAPPPPPEIAAPPVTPAPEPKIAVGGPLSGPPAAAGTPGAPQAPKAAKAPQEAVQAPRGLSAREEAVLAEWVAGGGQGAPVGLLRPWARSTGRPEPEVVRRWQEAAQARPEAAGALGEAVQVAGAVWTALVAEAAPVEQQVALPTVDDAFLYWATYMDGDLEEFGDWLNHYCPHLVDALEVWQPSDAPLTEGRLQVVSEAHARRTKTKAAQRTKRQLTTEQQEQYERWRRLVNTPAPVLRRFLMSEDFRKALKPSRAKSADLHLALDSSRRTFAMKATPVEEWTGDMWNWCGRQIRFISRLRNTSAPLIEQNRVTRKYLTLRAWGHNPTVVGRVTEAEVLIGQRQSPTVPWTCPHCRVRVSESALMLGPDGPKHDPCGHVLDLPRPVDEGVCATNRLIDALPGSGPRLIVTDEVEAPDFDALKRHRVKLADDERDAVFKAKAVWHNGPKGEKNPAVWKAKIDDSIWYVTNTHRCFQARPTLSGAISAFHRTVKATS